jgi:hypothetical protein
MVVEKVQDCVIESWDDAEKQREKIIQKLSEVKESLVQLQLSAVQQKEKAQPQQTVSREGIPSTGNNTYHSIRE